MILPILSKYLDIYSISAGDTTATYNYTWTDSDYYQQQIDRLTPISATIGVHNLLGQPNKRELCQLV
jgi:hypothetical protein